MLVSYFQLLSQQPFYRQITFSEGLPSNVVYDLHVAKNGLIYLGTENGLFMYNGIKFKKFPFKTTMGNSIDRINESESGRIWCMNFSNQIFELKNDTLIPTVDLSELYQTYGPIKRFLVVKEAVWVITEHLLFVVENNKILKKLDLTNQESSLFFTIEFNDFKNEIIVQTNKKTYVYLATGELKKERNLKIGLCEIDFYKGQTVHFEKNNIVESYLNFRKTPLLSKSKIEFKYLNKIIVDNNNFWMCTNNGIHLFETTKRTITKSYFQNTNITDSQIDKDGGMWISTVDKGIYYIPYSKVISYQLSEYRINKIVAEKENFWLGTGNGDLIKINKNGEIIQQIPTNFKTEIEFIYPDKNRLFTSHGFFENGKFTNIRFGKNIAEDQRGNFLICTYSKAIIFNKNLKDPPIFNGVSFPKAKFTAEYNLPSTIIHNNRSRAVVYSKYFKSFFIGTADELLCFNPTTIKINKIRYQGRAIVATHLTNYKENKVIASTIQNGILIIDNQKVITQITSKNGLSSDNCKKVIYDQNKLFILTEKGLDIYNITTKNIIHHTGIGTLFNLNIFDFIVDGNNIWLATSQGLIKTEFNLPLQNSLPEILNIETINDKGEETDQTNFQYSKNNLTFSLLAKHFKSFGEFEFQYRLVGQDDKWQTQQANNENFRFFNLPPGHYKFEVRTAYMGQFGKIHSRNFSIIPPFWNTWWFIILSLSITTVLLWLGLQFYLKNLQLKQLNRERLIMSQLTALRSQMNPHFLFNVLNSVQGLIYANKKTEATNYLGKFSTMMRGILENSNKQFISVKEEIQLLRNYLDLESSRFDGDFEFQIVNNLPEEKNLQMPSMILQPFVENAIKHGLLHSLNRKVLKIEFNPLNSNYFQVIIVDNGIGRKAAAEIQAKRAKHNSFATQAIDSRIELLNRTLKDKISINVSDFDTKNQSGTIVNLQIPFNHENPKSHYH